MARKRGMSLAAQADLEKKVERLKNAGAVARKRASANKDEGKQALAAMAGGALAGWFDAQQEMLLESGEENKYQIIQDIPTEGLLGAGLVVYGIMGKKSSTARKYSLSAGSGMLAYTVGNMAKKKTIEMAKEAS